MRNRSLIWLAVIKATPYHAPVTGMSVSVNAFNRRQNPTRRQVPD
jgi:hypothetical protein